MFAKTKVNGDEENSIYTFLKERCDSPQGRLDPTYKLLYTPLHATDIRWNFEKFLIDHHGNPIRRYHESIDPLELSNDIETMLAALPGQELELLPELPDDATDDDDDDDDVEITEEETPDLSVAES